MHKPTLHLMCGKIASGKSSHCVHYLEVDDDTCRSRLHRRNGRGEHEFAATDAEFDLITSYVRAPEEEEQLHIEIHRF